MKNVWKVLPENETESHTFHTHFCVMPTRAMRGVSMLSDSLGAVKVDPVGIALWHEWAFSRLNSGPYCFLDESGVARYAGRRHVSALPADVFVDTGRTRI